jgi:hypothetical protein
LGKFEQLSSDGILEATLHPALIEQPSSLHPVHHYPLILALFQPQVEETLVDKNDQLA